MASTISLRFVIIVLSVIIKLVSCTYHPNWKSLDSRPRPSWYDEVKVGIFMHWGVFSVPAYGNEWFWHNWKVSNNTDIDNFMKKNYPPDWTYADFANQFRAEMFDADFWADLIQASGARYYAITTKHHEGFCNWNTKVSFNWNSVAVGPNKDLVGAIAKAIRNRTTDVHFGIYHSLLEWFHPLYIEDKKNGFHTQYFPSTKTIPELYELIMNYEPELIWSDGNWEADSEYWNSTHFLAWLFNESPVKDKIVVNDRWGNDTMCKHGDYYTCQDRYNPGVKQKFKFENAMTVDKTSWGLNRKTQLSGYLTAHELITEIVTTVSCGGNILVNVGPTADGRILPIFEERLRQMGSWLAVNGEAIYKSEPWTFQNDTVTKHVWYTMRDKYVYAITLEWPSDGVIVLGLPEPSPGTTKVTMLGINGYTLDYIYHKTSHVMIIDVSHLEPDDLPCQWAWVFKMTHIQN